MKKLIPFLFFSFTFIYAIEVPPNAEPEFKGQDIELFRLLYTVDILEIDSDHKKLTPSNSWSYISSVFLFCLRNPSCEIKPIEKKIIKSIQLYSDFLHLRAKGLINSYPDYYYYFLAKAYFILRDEYKFKKYISIYSSSLIRDFSDSINNRKKLKYNKLNHNISLMKIMEVDLVRKIFSCRFDNGNCVDSDFKEYLSFANGKPVGFVGYFPSFLMYALLEFGTAESVSNFLIANEMQKEEPCNWIIESKEEAEILKSWVLKIYKSKFGIKKIVNTIDGIKTIRPTCLRVSSCERICLK